MNDLNKTPELESSTKPAIDYSTCYLSFDWQIFDSHNPPKGSKLLFLGKTDGWIKEKHFSIGYIEDFGSKSSPDIRWVLDCGGSFSIYKYSVMFCDIKINQKIIDELPDLPF